MVALIIVGIACLAVGVRRFSVRIRSAAQYPPRWLSFSRVILEAIAWVAFGVVVFVAGVASPGGTPWVIDLGMTGLVSAGLAWTSGRLLRSVSASSNTTVRAFLLDRAAVAGRRVRSALGNAARITAPTGFREVSIGFDTMERILGPKFLFRAYGVAVVVATVLVTLVVVQTLNGAAGIERQLINVLVGYSALATVSCITAALILTLAALAIMTSVRIVNIQLDVQHAFRTIATAVGYGTASGVIAAALLPVTSRLLPMGATDAGLESATLAPQMLLEVPAACAIVGFAFGVICAVVALCRRADNLLLRRFLAPTVLLVVLGGMVQLDYGPSGLLESILAPMGDVAIADCSERTISQHLGSPAWLMRAFQVCGGGADILDDQAFLWIVGSLCALVAILAFAMDFRRRNARTEELVTSTDD